MNLHFKRKKHVKHIRSLKCSWWSHTGFQCFQCHLFWIFGASSEPPVGRFLKCVSFWDYKYKVNRFLPTYQLDNIRQIPTVPSMFYGYFNPYFSGATETQTLNVWYIYLNLLNVGKINAYIECLGNLHFFPHVPRGLGRMTVFSHLLRHKCLASQASVVWYWTKSWSWSLFCSVATRWSPT